LEWRGSVLREARLRIHISDVCHGIFPPLTMFG
jgi:hypothetical protein